MINLIYLICKRSTDKGTCCSHVMANLTLFSCLSYMIQPQVQGDKLLPLLKNYLVLEHLKIKPQVQVKIKFCLHCQYTQLVQISFDYIVKSLKYGMIHDSKWNTFTSLVASFCFVRKPNFNQFFIQNFIRVSSFLKP